MNRNKINNWKNEKGSAVVIVLLVLMLLMALVVLAASKSSTDQILSYNDSVDTKTYNAAEAGLEDTTRNFASIIESRLNPTPGDLTNLKNSPVPNFSAFTFEKDLRRTKDYEKVVIQAGEFQGLNSLRDEWEIDVTATDPVSRVQSQLKRRFFNNRIPLFQFGAFYDDDLELNRPPLFVFGGRVHTNGNLFVSAYKQASGGGIYFNSKVTIVGDVITDIWKPGTYLTNDVDNTDDVYIVDSTNTYQKLKKTEGSVNCVQSTGGGVLKDPLNKNFPYPRCTDNSNFASSSTVFDGNLTTKVKPLKLPIAKFNPLIEIIRRGKNVGDMANINGVVQNVTDSNDDDSIVTGERLANKNGIRISLADSRAKLPQCANVVATDPCGVRLDGPISDSDSGAGNYLSRGYLPKPMKISTSSTNFDYQPTALNGNRLGISGRELWIKVELVKYDTDLQSLTTYDITEEFLSLGVTEPAPINLNPTPSDLLRDRISNFYIKDYDNLTDSRSIIKLQQFGIVGQTFSNSGTNYLSSPTTNFMAAVRYENVHQNMISAWGFTDLFRYYNYGCENWSGYCTTKNPFAQPYKNGGSAEINSREEYHYKVATFNSTSSPSNWASSSLSRKVIVPFPIKMFDTREGARADVNNLSSGNAYRNGVMSMINIDVYNLRRFLNGDFDDLFPTNTPYNEAVGHSLQSEDVPEIRGWVVYVSDRRGDHNFDGRYNMEDVDPASTSLVEEDLNFNGTIETDYTNEAPTQDSSISTTLAAATDHHYYRRGVRLINGKTLPGKYDSVTATNTRGFTFVSENGVYVQGNYNVTSVTLPGGSTVAPPENYFPQNDQYHIPAAIIGDAVTILSNNWDDGKSFAYPLSEASRVASDTQVRFAMISGDSITDRDLSGGFAGLNGGLHNFKRFLEKWKDKRLNYSGSLVNLYNAFNNNGQWKCCTTVYEPPIRDWTFEESFSDPDRLPPATPFVYNLSFTGFERVTPIN